MNRHPALALVALGLVASLVACLDLDPKGLSAKLTTPAAPVKGKVGVSFTVSDPGKSPATVVLEYSTDGVTYQKATVAGKTSGLASDGTTHTLTWDTLADLGATLASAVTLKLTPEAGGVRGYAEVSGAFDVDNTGDAGGNAPPTLALIDPKGAATSGSMLPTETFYGHLLITYTVTDLEGDASDVTVEYSTDGGASFAPATPADDAPTGGLASGGTHTFLWDSIADVGKVEAEVVLRLTAADSKPGRPIRSGFLALRNEKLLVPRGPLLQLVTSTSILIKWRTTQRTTGLVDYGTTPEHGGLVYHRESKTDHLVELTDLAPDTYYHYAVTSSGGLAIASKFRTTPGPGSPFGFAAFGDSGVGGIMLHTQSELAKFMLEREPDLVIHTGDVVYPEGEDRHYEDAFFLPYKALGARAPFFLCLGNHDIKTDDGAPYLKIFHLPSNNPAKTERYYSFDYGDVHFVCLDSTHKDKIGPGTAQYEWLVADLSKSTAKWTVVFFHHPMYSSGRHGSQSWVKDAWEGVFETYGVDLVLVGHDHMYERTKPMKGVVHVLTGGGGAPVYPIKPGNAFTAYALADWNFTHVDVTTKALKITGVDMLGKVIDTHTITK